MFDNFDADAIAKSLVEQSFGSGWVTHEQKIAAALRAAEARGLERAKRDIRHWSLTQAEILRDIGVCDALISFIGRALSESPD